MMTTLDGFAVPVGLAGQEKGVVVVVLGDEDRPVAAYDAVCERLHTASLRTVVIGFDARLTAKSVVFVRWDAQKKDFIPISGLDGAPL